MLLPAEKGFDKYQHPLLIIKCQEYGHRMHWNNRWNIINVNPTSNTILSGEKMTDQEQGKYVHSKHFALSSGQVQGCLLSPRFSNIMLLSTQ